MPFREKALNENGKFSIIYLLYITFYIFQMVNYKEINHRDI